MNESVYRSSADIPWENSDRFAFPSWRNARDDLCPTDKFSKAFRGMTSRPFEASCQLVSESWRGLNRRPGIDSFATRAVLVDDNGGDKHKYEGAKFDRVERTG